MHQPSPAVGVPRCGHRHRGWIDARGETGARCRAEAGAVLPDPFQHTQDRGVEPAIRHPARPVDGRQRPPRSPRDLHDPAGSGEPVEHRQLGVVAEARERDVHGIELRLDLGPCGVGRGQVCGACGRVRPRRGGGRSGAARIRGRAPRRRRTQLARRPPEGRRPRRDGRGRPQPPEAPVLAVVRRVVPPPDRELPAIAPRMVTVGSLMRAGRAAAVPWTSATSAASESRRAS